MSDLILQEPIELTDAELDVVSAGQNNQGGAGLIVAGVQIGDVTVTDVVHNVAILSNGVQIPVGVAVAALGGAAGVLNKLA